MTHRALGHVVCIYGASEKRIEMIIMFVFGSKSGSGIYRYISCEVRSVPSGVKSPSFLLQEEVVCMTISYWDVEAYPKRVPSASECRRFSV